MIPGNAKIVKCPYCGTEKMKECAEILSSIPYDSLQDYEKSIYMGIKERAQNNDIKVFKLSL